MRRVLVLTALLAGVARAEDPATTAEERELLQKLDAAQYVKARDQAEAILAAHPDSFAATWAMTLIHHDEEANHARALFFVRRAEAALVARGGDPEWHKKVLIETYWILFEMNRNQEALDLLDRYDQLYGATHAELRIWPLFKLGRADDARAIALKLAASDDWMERAEGYNGMLSLEYEAHDREASYHWAVDGVRATQERSCTLLRNAAGSSYSRFRLRESEDFALSAHKAGIRDCPLAGYDQLAGLYLIEGEFQKSLSAIETLKSQPIEKRLRPHFALRRRVILVDVLYTLGKVEEAERMATELYGLPERTGMTSSSQASERFSRSFRYWMTLDTRLVLEAEKSSYRPLFSGLSTDAVKLTLSRWEVRRALIQLAAEGEVLVSLVRPNLGDLDDWTSWKVGGLIAVLGTDVMKSAIAAARVADEKYPEATAYLDAFAGEVAYRAGDLAEADRLASAALPALPKEEALMRWRTLTWQADARRRLGRVADARPLYQEILGKFPTALRILDIPLPARVGDDHSQLAHDAAVRLARSSRFLTSGDAPFRLEVSSRGGVVGICLTDDTGFQFACGTGEKKESDDASITSALDAFHSAAFSPKVSLKQSDLNSLDGSPVRVDADQVLKDVLSP